MPQRVRTFLLVNGLRIVGACVYIAASFFISDYVVRSTSNPIIWCAVIVLFVVVMEMLRRLIDRIAKPREQQE